MRTFWFCIGFLTASIVFGICRYIKRKATEEALRGRLEGWLEEEEQQRKLSD